MHKERQLREGDEGTEKAAGRAQRLSKRYTLRAKGAKVGKCG
jgi:hypothetical protein